MRMRSMSGSRKERRRQDNAQRCPEGDAAPDAASSTSPLTPANTPPNRRISEEEALKKGMEEKSND